MYPRAALTIGFCCALSVAGVASARKPARGPVVASAGAALPGAVAAPVVDGVRGRLSLIAVRSGPDNTLDFVARVVNSGSGAAMPSHATLTIRDSEDKVVVHKSWSGHVVLAGATRDFIVPLRTQLPAGAYTAVGAMTFGATRHTRVSTAFTLVDPNVLATRAVALEGLAAGSSIGGVAHVNATLRSVGNASSGTTVTVALYRLASGQLAGPALATRVLHFHGILPGSTRRVSVMLGSKLRRGMFHVVVSYHDRPGSQATVHRDFTPHKHVVFILRAARWILDNIILVLTVAAVLILLAVTAVTAISVRWQRWRAAKRAAHAAWVRRQRRLAAELAVASAARGRERRLAAELAANATSPRRQERVAAKLAATAAARRRQRRLAAELAVACRAAAQAKQTENRPRQAA